MKCMLKCGYQTQHKDIIAVTATRDVPANFDAELTPATGAPGATGVAGAPGAVGAPGTGAVGAIGGIGIAPAAASSIALFIAAAAESPNVAKYKSPIAESPTGCEIALAAFTIVCS